MNLEAGNEEKEKLRPRGSCEEHGPFVLRKGGIPMAGRKPKPTALKKLEGNPGKRKLNTKEPVPEKGMPDCPKWLLSEAKVEWNRLCKKLSEMGVLTEIDMVLSGKLNACG